YIKWAFYNKRRIHYRRSICFYYILNKQRSIFTSSQALMKAIYLDYKKFEIGGAKSVKKRKVILM
ncbi:MAG: hypothetical protein WBO33_04630, partial [Blautia wexlerae]